MPNFRTLSQTAPEQLGENRLGGVGGTNRPLRPARVNNRRKKDKADKLLAIPSKGDG